MTSATDAQLRCDAYGTLRWGLLATHPNAWEVVRSPAWLQRIEAILHEAGLHAALANAAALREAVQRYASADEWAGAYHGAFGGSLRISPYEADHTASHVFMEARELADVAGFYRAFGYELALERPDHVGAELEFLHVLAHKEAALARMGDGEGAAVCADATRKFLEGHPGRFIAALHRDAQERDAPAFFVHTLALARAFIERDVTAMGLSPPPLPDRRGLAAALPDSPECAARPPAAPEGTHAP